MGIVVIGGLLVSTIVTLIVVPVLYAIFVRNDEKKKLDKLRKSFVFMQIGQIVRGLRIPLCPSFAVWVVGIALL